MDVNIDTLVDRQGTEILRPVEQMLKEAGIPVEMEITVGDPGPESVPRRAAVTTWS